MNAGAKIMKPTTQPGTNDYLESLRAALGRAIYRAQHVIERESILASQNGNYGNSIQRSVDSLQLQFDTGITVALKQLKRAKLRKSLYYSELWQVTVQELETFMRQMKSLVDHEGLAALRLSNMTLVRSELAKFEDILSSALRQFQAESLDVGALPTPSEESKETIQNLGASLTELSNSKAEKAPADAAELEVPDDRGLSAVESLSAVRGMISSVVSSSTVTTGPSSLLTVDFKNSFFESMMRCVEWKFGSAEPEIPFNTQLYKISAVCRSMMTCKNEPLPGKVADVLARLPEPIRTNLIEELGKDLSYHGGARFVLGLVEK
jgi:hypothetical protein